ncbi:MAG: serine hydrolase domain-containing protein [Bacteroidia bacterium]|nr:serine hydrolase domain-containing protein [Bacteroidia bacterium]
MKRIIFPFLLLFLSNSFQLLAQNSTSPEIEASIDRIFASYQDQAGCALGIYKEGKIFFQKGYGQANLEKKTPISSRTIFDIASVSKQFTAACIFLLEAEGKLSLEDPIQKHLPQFPVYEGQDIKVKHLLYHSSGLRGYLRLLYAQGKSWDLPFNNEDGLELMAKQRGLNFDPGDRFSYSNTAYMLLASIVEEASGSSFGQFAKKRIFEPLGMHHTFFREDTALEISDQALAYEWQNGAFELEHYQKNTIVGDGGLHTNIEDFFKWSENFKHARLGGKSFINSMLSLGSLNSGEKTNYAGGLFLGDYQNLPGLPTIGHDGSWAGFRSLFFKFPEQDIAFVIFSNNSHTDVWALLNQLTSLFLAEEIAAAREKLNTEGNDQDEAHVLLNKKAKSNFPGSYFNPVEGYSRNILLENDTLIYQRSNGITTKLIPLSENRFHLQGLSFVQLVFQSSATGIELKFQVANDPPIYMHKYTPRSYQKQELKAFEGSYTSEELESSYIIKAAESSLHIFIGSDLLVEVFPVMEDVFNDVHFGYLKFERSPEGQISSFTINDELARDILFLRRS